MIRYFDINWMSMKDGPGQRIVLFLQGCNLKCSWCHMPHSQTFYPPLLYNSEYCTGCGKCISGCSRKAISLNKKVLNIDREKCISCGNCIICCKFNALNIKFNEKTDVELSNMLLPELRLLKGSGGLTISGGEPLLQAKELEGFFRILSQEGIDIAVETSGYISLDHIKILEKYVNVWLFGLKQTDTYLCKKQTGGDFKIILENLNYLANLDNRKIIIRTPIVPDNTDSIENFTGIRGIMNKLGLKNLEFLKYNPLTPYYYHLMGIVPPQLEFNPTCVENIEKVFESSGIDVKIL